MTEKKKSDRPHGKDEVKKAILESAVKLFTKNNYSEVSIRDIAAEAGINHGLIHRHFGTKEELRRQALLLIDSKMRRSIGTPESLYDAMMASAEIVGKDDSYWKMTARFLLDQEIGKNPVDNYLKDIVKLAEKDQLNGKINQETDPRFIVCALAAFGLGIDQFHSYLLPSTGLNDTKERRDELFRYIINKIISK